MVFLQELWGISQADELGGGRRPCVAAVQSTAGSEPRSEVVLLRALAHALGAASEVSRRCNKTQRTSRSAATRRCLAKKGVRQQKEVSSFLPQLSQLLNAFHRYSTPYAGFPDSSPGAMCFMHEPMC